MCKIDFQDGGHLGFLFGMILAIFVHRLPWYFLPCFEWISSPRHKTDFQDGGQDGHLLFWIGELLAILQAAQYFLPSFEAISLLVQKKQGKIDFQDGDHLGFPIRTILASFDLTVAPILPTKFQVNWPFGSGEVQNRFSRWQPSWISDQNDFTYFWSTSHPDTFYQVLSESALGCRRSSLLKQIVDATRYMTYINHNSSCSGELIKQNFYANTNKISKSVTPGPSCSKRCQLNELVKGHFVNCFRGFNLQYSDICCWKNVSSFCTAKPTNIFQQKISAYLRITWCKF